MADPCGACGFELWHPIADLRVADLALYSDHRFPGRAILSLRDHYDGLQELPDDLALDFHRDVRDSIGAILRATGASRVNFAVLGNSVAHVHGHLIPRYPAEELLPESSPWDDPRPRGSLGRDRVDSLIEQIREELNSGQ